MAATTKTSKKRAKKQFANGIVCVRALYNNTIVTLTDPDGNVLGWASPGRMGFKGARQSTPYAAQVSGESVAEQAKNFGMTEVKVVIKGPGPGREQAVRGLINGGLDISQILDKTRLPHGGCRVRRQRRV